MSYGTQSYKFRTGGLLLAVAFHVIVFASTMADPNALAGGYKLLFAWYMPSIVLGFPWSIPALFLDALFPSGSILGLIAAVCFNGYLLGWPLDAISNSGTSSQQLRKRAAYRAAALRLKAESEIGAGESARADDVLDGRLLKAE